MTTAHLVQRRDRIKDEPESWVCITREHAEQLREELIAADVKARGMYRNLITIREVPVWVPSDAVRELQRAADVHALEPGDSD